MAHQLIYGGTFDPIHVGHLITCRRARELLGADRVLFVPANVSPHKQDAAKDRANGAGASAAQRLEMIRLAITGDAGFAVDDRELHRTGPSYTINTVLSVQQEFPADRLTLLIGSDQFIKLHTWLEIDRLLTSVGIAILPRAGAMSIEEGLCVVEKNLGTPAAEKLRRSLLATPLIEISATDIRRRVREGLSINYLVPPEVMAYIYRETLYR